MQRARVVALLAGAAAGTFPARLRASGPPIRLGSVPVESYAEPLYAADAGYFAKAGLDVELNLFTTGGQITNALAGGALDVGLADPVQLASAVIKGVPFAYFAGGAVYSTRAPTTQLCVASAGQIHSVKDLGGQTIGVNGLHSLAEIANREWLRTNGVDPATVKFVEMPPTAMVPAIARGTIAAGMVTEPTLSSLADSGVVPLGKFLDAVGPTFYFNAWFAYRDWLTKNAALASTLVGAIYAAARWANANRDATAPILAKYAKLELAQIQHMTRAAYATTLDPNMIQPELDIASRYNILERPVSAAELIVQVRPT